jgi:hypothetical protein
MLAGRFGRDHISPKRERGIRALGISNAYLAGASGKYQKSLTRTLGFDAATVFCRRRDGAATGIQVFRLVTGTGSRTFPAASADKHPVDHGSET